MFIEVRNFSTRDEQGAMRVSVDVRSEDRGGADANFTVYLPASDSITELRAQALLAARQFAQEFLREPAKEHPQRFGT